MQSAKMSNLRHDSQSQPFYGHNWVGEQILFHYICCINIFISDSTHSFIPLGSESIDDKTQTIRSNLANVKQKSNVVVKVLQCGLQGRR